MNWTALAFSAFLLLCPAGCGPRGQITLKVFHAGSLAVPFRALEQIFEAENPGMDVQRQAYGSATAIRQITEVGKRADVVASADYRLIDRLMIEPDRKWADWNILFARNAICIAYRNAAKGITSEAWAAALTSGNVRIGLSDPNQDPCGYRSLFCIYLAEKLAGKERLLERLIQAHSNVTVQETDGAAVIRVPAGIVYREPLVMRPKETDLIALLETGAIDCMFIYRSIAVQHGLDFIELPDGVNLGSLLLAEKYSQVRVLQWADRGDRVVEVVARPILYGLTIPSSAPHPEAAASFVRLVLSERGRRVMERCGQDAVTPPLLSPASRAETAPLDLLKLSQ